MPKWEIAIAVCNEPEAHRKQEGDIIAVKPFPWTWGTKELAQYFIVIVDGMTQDEVHSLCVPLYENGETNQDVIMDNNLKKLGKRKFSVSLDLLKKGWFPQLDLAKVRDKTVVYQDMKDAQVVIDSTERVALFYDKFLLSYRYKKERVA